MAASSFEAWVFGKLRSLNIDHEIFGSYIIGIIETDDSEEDKREALEGILNEVTDTTSDLCDELLSQWKKFNSDKLTNENSEQIAVDMNSKLASIMEEQARCVVSERERTAEQQHLREIILAQCNRADQEDEKSEILVDPGGDDVAASGGTAPDTNSFSRNSNAEAVLQADKEKREKSKQEHEKKKAQDKLNKEKQKQQQQERKEKEKKRTQKGERKR